MFPENFVLLISDDIKEDHICGCLIAERENQKTLGTKLGINGKTSRSETDSVSLPKLLKETS